MTTTAGRGWSRLRGRVLVVASVVLLATTTYVGVAMLQQVNALDDNAARTQGLVNANLRILGQVQREVLRLEVLLTSGDDDLEAIELQQAFVTQRMTEVSNSYLLSTLRTDELLDATRAWALRWNTEVIPLIERSLADPADEQLRHAVVQQLEDLELRFNELISKSENNRRRSSAEANVSARELLSGSRVLVAVQGASIAGFVGFVLLTLRHFARHERHQREAASELLALNAELHTLSEVAARTGNGVIITDAEGRVAWVNDAFTRLTGYDAADVIGGPSEHVLFGETHGPFVGEMQRCMSEGLAFTGEVETPTKDGSSLWVAIELQPVRDACGALRGFIVLQTDVTERRESEEHLRKAKEAAEETAQAKAQFLANMSHEIRTPLNAVIALNELLLDTPLTPQQRQWADTARSSGDLLLALVNDILTVSAIDAGRIELADDVVDLDELVGETLRLFESDADQRGVRLSHQLDPKVPTAVRGDANRLRQILVNVIGNGVKFTERGAVSVTVGSQDADDEGRHLIEIVVADSGIGIPADRIGKLFQPFTQVDASTSRTYGGTGLGLAISKGLVERMGGQITIESAPGEGTTVRMCFPLVPADPHAKVTAPRVDTALGGSAAGTQVLLVEDDPVNQHVTLALLRKLGVHADLAEDGDEAVEAVKAKSYDIVLMDVHLPRCDGPTATGRIRAELPAHRQPHIVALTANALEGDRERFLAAGMDDYLSKPARLQDLAAALRGGGPEKAPPPPVDPSAIAALVGVDDPDLVATLVGAFVADGAPVLAAVAEVASRGDLAELLPLTGRLRSLAAGAGAAAIVAAADALRRACLDGDADHAGRLGANLPALLQAVEAWLRDALTRA